MQKAIDLVTKATEADRDKNFSEACRLYEHGVEHFLHSLKYEALSEKEKESIRARCIQYLERAEKLKEYLKKQEGKSILYIRRPVKDGDRSGKKEDSDSDSDTDPDKKKMLSKLEGAIVIYVKWSDVNVNVKWSALQKAIDLVTKACEADRDKNFSEACRLYEHGVELFLHSLKYEAQSEKGKESIRAKCFQYLERAEKLKEYLKKKASQTKSL